MAAHRVFRVGISGSYGGWNLGDEAILQGIIEELRRAAPVEITVFTRDPADTLRRHHVERAVPVRQFLRGDILPELRPLDLFILGGGGILFDAEVRTFLREVELAHELGVPVMLYAVGAGPLVDHHIQAHISKCLDKAKIITVRDWRSKHLLESCGVLHEIEVTADPALLSEPEPIPEDLLVAEGFAAGRRLIGMSVRERGPAAPALSEVDYHSLLACAADFMVDRLNADLIFVPMERKHDFQNAHAVLSRMQSPERASVLRGNYTAGQLLSLIRRFEFAVGMRLHFLTLVALARVPFVPLSYAPKVLGFVEKLGIHPEPLDQLEAGRLIAHIDRAWDERAAIQARIGENLPRLQARAQQTSSEAVGLLLGQRKLKGEDCHGNHAC